MFTDIPTKSGGSGVLWQEGGIEPSRLVERYLIQEEQNLTLSDMHPSGQGSVEYDRNGPHAQLLVHESSNDSVIVPIGAGIGQLREGCLRGSSYIWRAQGDELCIWDCLDKSRSRFCRFKGPTASAIVHVGLVDSAAPGWKHWLVVATVNEVALYYFCPDKLSDENPPVLSGFVAVTGGVPITAITGGWQERVFLGGADGSVFELVVKPPAQSPSLTALLSGILFNTSERRCYLSVIYRSTWLGWFSGVSGTGAVRGIEIDACRELMYVLNSDNSVRVFSLSGGQVVHAAELSGSTVNGVVSAAIRTAGLEARIAPAAQDEVVALVASNPHIGGDILFVCVTRIGVRVFVKAAGGGTTPLKEKKSCSICTTVVVPQSLGIHCVKVPDRHPPLTVEAVFSGDFGRTMFLVSSSGVVVIRPDEASVVHRSSSKNMVRERYDYLPVPGVVRYAVLVADQGRAPKELRGGLPTHPGLLGISTDDLGYVEKARLVIVSSEAREMVVSVPRATELVVSVLSAKNLHAIRDLSIQLGSDQLAALMFSILVTMTKGTKGSSGDFVSLVERILFSPDTATALGFVDIGTDDMARVGGFGAAQPSNPLGSVTQSLAHNVCARTKGLALYVSRVVRPVWFSKLLKLELAGSVLSVKPVLSANQRNYVTALLEPVHNAIAQYRYQLGTDLNETKLVDKFVVLLSGLLEVMELLRIVESGQLTVKSETAPSEFTAEFLAEIDNIQLRDLLAGPSDSLRQLFEGSDLTALRKHCPNIFSKE